MRDYLAEHQLLVTVQEVCTLLTDSGVFESAAEAVEYLQDYRRLSQEHERFHAAWLKLPNMANVLEFDRSEIEQISKLIVKIEKC